jgi:hypothetical protein
MVHGGEIMTKKVLRNPECFEILDEDSLTVYKGCNQVWYKKKWRKMAGCGPTAASNIVIYSNKNKINKNDALEIMDELWNYVTPTLMGVNTTEIFYEGFMKYAAENNRNAQFKVIDIPKEKETRPSYEMMFDFIEASLDNDVPIAFLNLCNGEEKFLDKWHWVTIISLEYEGDKSLAAVEILDEGMVKKINLPLWYRTTTLGGGLVSFSIE